MVCPTRPTNWTLPIYNVLHMHRPWSHTPSARFCAGGVLVASCAWLSGSAVGLGGTEGATAMVEEVEVAIEARKMEAVAMR